MQPVTCLMLLMIYSVKIVIDDVRLKLINLDTSKFKVHSQTLAAGVFSEKLKKSFMVRVYRKDHANDAQLPAYRYSPCLQFHFYREYSLECVVNFGVAHRSLLGPVLIDDNLIYLEIPSERDQDLLQKCLNATVEFCAKVEMRPNYKKSVFVTFQLAKDPFRRV
ncbi:hypothetical protein J6590_074962 [Homalodisca vitripennis]|nr:hypothetical protein J6590_074962 [Homalodisca vitripennis]